MQQHAQSQEQQQQEQAEAEPPAGTVAVASRAAGGKAAVGAASGAAGFADSLFLPVNTLAWEERICWQGAVKPGDGGGVAGESQHGTDDEEAAMAGMAAEGAGEGTVAAEQWDQRQQQQGQPQYGGQDDIAAMFQQQQQQHQLEQQQLLHQRELDQQEQQRMAATQFGDGLPVVFMPAAAAGANGGASLPMVQHQQHEQLQSQHGLGAWQPPQQPGAGATSAAGFAAAATEELPGLSSVTAAEAEARAAAESDEEEFWALPTAPLLRLELQSLANGGHMGEPEARRPLPQAPDMLPGVMLATYQLVCGTRHWHVRVCLCMLVWAAVPHPTCVCTCC